MTFTEFNSTRNQFKSSQEIENLNKELSVQSSEKEKLEERLERCRMELTLSKQENPVREKKEGKINTLTKCINKQARLIANLKQQISYYEHFTSQEKDSLTATE